MEIDGNLNHDGTQIGFFGIAPAAQQSTNSSSLNPTPFDPAGSQIDPATAAAIDTNLNELQTAQQAILDLLKIQDALKANEATFHPENLQTMSKKELKEQLEKDLYMRLQIMQLVDVVKTDIEVIEEHVDEMEMELEKHKATHGHGH